MFYETHQSGCLFWNFAHTVSEVLLILIICVLKELLKQQYVIVLFHAIYLVISLLMTSNKAFLLSDDI